MLNIVRRNLQLHYANSFLKCCNEKDVLLNVRRKFATGNRTSTLPKKPATKIEIARQPVPSLEATLFKYLKYVISITLMCELFVGYCIEKCSLQERAAFFIIWWVSGDGSFGRRLQTRWWHWPKTSSLSPRKSEEAWKLGKFIEKMKKRFVRIGLLNEGLVLAFWVVAECGVFGIQIAGSCLV